MPRPKIAARLAESYPGLGFLAVLLLTDDLRLAGWTGAMLALALMLWLGWRGRRPDTIALGLNLFTLLCAPLVETLHLLGHGAQGRLLLDHLRPALLVTVALTGAALTLLTPSGFVGRAGAGSRRGSLALLLLALVAALLLARPPVAELPLNAAAALLGLFLARRWIARRAVGAPA
ncbi:hypothetical protein [Limimaricola pyoseonensis]|uniref:Uncharacterized protein n=1 Tax=Limimaricola pyoseonensis TaxID=521013 RepID=A0A1G7GYI2_9RHOB|nr:hypothetical protein [Limimaricola pyoseonensis]SDE93123.1 hypothetical protein SAMN04488567_2982 [Limimaricola pyoseonensis]